MQQTTDPRGIASLTDYDLLGRTVRSVAAFTDFDPSAADDGITEYEYDSGDHLWKLRAMLPGGTFQQTQYVYGPRTTTSSDLNSNEQLVGVAHPDKSTGLPNFTTEKETFTVNALGERKRSTDRNGSTHTFSYDVLGRLTTDANTTLGGGLSSAVLRLEMAYDGAGLRA